MASEVCYQDRIKSKIEEAEELINKCKDLKVKDGQKKLQKKIEAELKFLCKLLKHPERIKNEHLRCSNLSHLSAILCCAMSTVKVSEILKPFSYIVNNIYDENEQKRIVVDVVANDGQCWIKVVARNPQAMAHSSIGSCEFGRRTIIKQLEDMIECAKQNPYMYQSICIKVWFTSGITRHLKEKIEKLGIEVIADNIQDDPIFFIDAEDKVSSSCEDSDDSENELVFIKDYYKFNNFKADNTLPLREQHENNLESSYKHDVFSLPSEAALNLDVSTMIAYISALTNGHCNVKFTENILTEQAEREREFPVKSVLDKLFEDRTLICCETAYKDFNKIVATIGGKYEKLRAEELLSRIAVVPDCPSENALSLRKSSKVKKRPMVIYILQ
ncbi:UPF0415 protein C7orf25 homolog [Centruroides sculpturatus]|uniref:UPF0415 protein C7orf25 homolog n=1 Tax=Centruroides sculpturatus TaxID=218467 RepID=UPI000C6D6343|nr:UPF0415 protein C7orf25 homolog [Centruroides sculpturatus]